MATCVRKVYDNDKAAYRKYDPLIYPRSNETVLLLPGISYAL